MFRELHCCKALSVSGKITTAITPVGDFYPPEATIHALGQKKKNLCRKRLTLLSDAPCDARIKNSKSAASRPVSQPHVMRKNRTLTLTIIQETGNG